MSLCHPQPRHEEYLECSSHKSTQLGSLSLHLLSWILYFYAWNYLKQQHPIIIDIYFSHDRHVFEPFKWNIPFCSPNDNDGSTLVHVQKAWSIRSQKPLHLFYTFSISKFIFFTIVTLILNGFFSTFIYILFYFLFSHLLI